MFGGETGLMPVNRLPNNTIATMPHTVSQNHKKIFRKSRGMGILAFILKNLTRSLRSN
jgi:hypothetical protein